MKWVFPDLWRGQPKTVVEDMDEATRIERTKAALKHADNAIKNAEAARREANAFASIIEELVGGPGGGTHVR